MTMQESAKPRRGVFGRRTDAGEPPASIDEAVERTENALHEMGATAMTDEQQQPDPAPSAPAIAEERAQQLLTNISSQTLGELRELRDQIDDLMRDIISRRDALREAIKGHAEFAETTIQAKTIISESVAQIRASFDRSNTPLPPVHKVR